MLPCTSRGRERRDESGGNALGRCDRWAFGAFVVLAVALAAFHVAYIALGRPVSDAAQQLTAYSLALFLLWWVVADARRVRGRLPCHDFGFLMGIGFPVSLVWYLVWSRGWKGLGTWVVLLLLLSLPTIAADVAWLTLPGPP